MNRIVKGFASSSVEPRFLLLSALLPSLAGCVGILNDIDCGVAVPQLFTKLLDCTIEFVVAVVVVVVVVEEEATVVGVGESSLEGLLIRHSVDELNNFCAARDVTMLEYNESNRLQYLNILEVVFPPALQGEGN